MWGFSFTSQWQMAACRWTLLNTSYGKAFQMLAQSKNFSFHLAETIDFSYSICYNFFTRKMRFSFGLSSGFWNISQPPTLDSTLETFLLVNYCGWPFKLIFLLRVKFSDSYSWKNGKDVTGRVTRWKIYQDKAVAEQAKTLSEVLDKMGEQIEVSLSQFRRLRREESFALTMLSVLIGNHCNPCICYNISR